MSRTVYGDIAGESGLPPEEFWLINPDRDKFETPVDDRGFVDVPTLIQAVKDTMDPVYEWPEHLSVHHLYWKEDWYSSAFIGMNGQKFRELPIHKAMLPRVFENWLHKVTVPPDVPDPELMHRRIQSWNVASDLFHTVRSAVKWERRARRRADYITANPSVLPKEFEGEDIIGKEVIGRIMTKYFSGIEIHLERIQAIPEEDRLIDPELDPRELASQLGRIVIPASLRLTNAVAA
jgi:hypothetical protein